MIRILVILLCFFAISSCSHVEKENANAVVPNLVSFQSESGHQKLSEIFTNYKLVQLETNDSCLLNGNGKILKCGSIYYVRSANSVFEFGADGHFIRCLSRVGSAPHEYVELYDFDVLETNNLYEIWISTLGGIKIYDSETLDFKRGIPVEGHVNQFKYVNDNTILLVTPGDITFKVCDIHGNIRKEFMEKDLANGAFQIVQFGRYDDKMTYHLDCTQEGVIYDEKSDSLYVGHLFPPQENLVTTTVNREYYEQYGWKEQYKKVVEKYSTLVSFRTWKKNVALTMRHPDEEITITLFDGNKAKTHRFSKNPSLLNDIVPTTSLGFLATLACCESDSGFLFMIGDERISEEEQEKNPILLDVCGFNL